MPVRLIVKSKAETAGRPRETVLAADQITLGRDKACDLVLNDPVVSRRHVQIVREGALYFLEDLGSSYGTRVNGAELPAGEKRLLRNGDTLAIGPFDVAFDRIADVETAGTNEKTAYVAKRSVKNALRGLATEGGPYLRVMNGPHEGQRLEIHDAHELVVGREEGVDFRIEDDDLVSRRHAKIRRDWTGTYLEDLNSRNGVKVNRRRVTTQALKDRDELEIGSTRFLYIDPAEVREPVVVPEVKPAPAPVAEPEPPEGEPAEEEAEAVESEPDSEPEPEQDGDEPASDPEAESGAEASGQEEADAEAGAEDEAEPDEAPDSAGDPEALAEAPAGADPRPSKALGRRLAAPVPGGWRNLVPLLVVGGVALFALGLLAVTFFVM